MRRTTFIAATLAAVLVVGYGGWLSAGGPGDSGGTQPSQSTSGKPGEPPKH